MAAQHPQPDGEQDSLVALDEAFKACLITLPTSSYEDEVVRIMPDIHTGRGTVGIGSMENDDRMILPTARYLHPFQTAP